MCWKAGCRGLGLNLFSGYLPCVFSQFLCFNAIKTKKSFQNLEGMLIKLNKFMCLGMCMCVPLVHVRAPVLPHPPPASSPHTSKPPLSSETCLKAETCYRTTTVTVNGCSVWELPSLCVCLSQELKGQCNGQV